MTRMITSLIATRNVVRSLPKLRTTTVLLMLCLYSLTSITSRVSADALGATDSIEIIKLTELIAQMTTLLDKTEYLIDVQESVEGLQEQSLLRKSSSYGPYLQLLGGLIGGEVGVRAQQLSVLVSLDAAMRELAARTNDSSQRDGLYLMSDSLRLLMESSILLESSSHALQEASTNEEFNSQDQLLASVQRTLAIMNAGNTRLRVNRNIRVVNNQNMLLSSFNVFSRR